MSNGDDDMSGLGLSLGLGCGVAENQNPNQNQMNQYPQTSLKLNLMPFPSFFAQINHHRTSLNDLFQSADRNTDTRSFQRVPDMNRMPQIVECEDEAGVSSPNSTISSLSGKRSEREQVGGCEEAEAERTSCSQGGSDDDDGGGAGDGDGDASRKKLRLSKEQSILLEETFKEHNTLNPKQKLALAKQLNLRPRQVEVWFQNRRARTKLKQTEVDCEYLKRCCENLTQENRRLQKEVQELRALKLSPQLYMHMNPPTTLTMCPSCERVAVSSTSAAAAVAATNRHPGNPQPQRPMPIKAWAALPIQQHRSMDSSASRS
ncbi:homeobox-leucine zipper protein HAT3 [Mercurialis annua]|uniref:homeobox-leucine zipper protein HAT3 n=1 Tax=Mercurialis annua TaxID=3986 RepID=UPI002160C9AE|nr:homeobox-leucine zipper protein HAT3 [Mercurialis annua]